MKYAFVDRHRLHFKTEMMCQTLGVARSGYYLLRRRRDELSANKRRAQARVQTIYQLFDQRKGRYGSPQIARDLRRTGMACNAKTVALSMRRQGLVAKAGRKVKATTNSRHSLPVAPNLLEQDFTANAPNQKWCSDITYLWTDEGWLYLATVIDLFSRKVIGWSMSERMKADLVCDALRMALRRRGNPRDVIVHSDRGSQYCSNPYQTIIKRYGLRCSMSRKADCYDNACAESFFHSLKVEAIHGEKITTRAQARQIVFEYIESDYNRTRQHSTIGYLSPEVFETLHAA